MLSIDLFLSNPSDLAIRYCKEMEQLSSINDLQFTMYNAIKHMPLLNASDILTIMNSANIDNKWKFWYNSLAGSLFLLAQDSTKIKMTEYRYRNAFLLFVLENVFQSDRRNVNKQIPMSVTKQRPNNNWNRMLRRFFFYKSDMIVMQQSLIRRFLAMRKTKKMHIYKNVLSEICYLPRLEYLDGKYIVKGVIYDEIEKQYSTIMLK